MKYKEICEMDASGIVGALLGGGSPGAAPCGAPPVDTTSDVGEFGSCGHQPEKISVQITEEEDGVKISTDAMCVKLHTPIIEALKVYFEKKSEGE